MQPVRVFFPFVGGDTFGGSHVSTLSLIAGLDRARFEPIIALHREGGALGDYIRSLGLDYRLLTEPGIIAPRYSRSAEDVSFTRFLVRSVPRLVALLREMDVDIVHTNDGRMHANWALPTRLSGAAFIWHHRQGPDAAGVNRIAPLLADRIFCVSAFSQPRKPIRSVADRLEIVRSPFDFSKEIPSRDECHAVLCTELGLPENAVLLGYFGVLNQRKRPEHFVRALADIVSALSDRAVHGCVFGKLEIADSGLDERCRSLAASLGIGEHLHLMGHRSPIEPAMAAMDAMLVTALEEPFGRTLIEAMHLGTPVIATEHGGNPEAIRDGDTGFLVDPFDPSAFVTPVYHLLQEAGLASAITARAQEHVHDTLGTARHIEQVSRIYDDLVSRRRRRAYAA
ncbi:glycosyltransferase family 4 protein [Aliiruegeria lutimaris]|uniref:Glycosyltransferase involved in cell wall bisynthesis n=1 Tax=Aliiruegeria lutimaris TaxID=571298 RepID=A0A1G9FTG4_9RHOB|nr:glycosyltransferase family 4 protein [Aliiruegeria lutimaris]SDK91701.1 Glycosyltransferase involved in cell wall bisynthesis [Aliiruegeria lutimaris]